MKIVYIARKFLEGFAYQDNELAEMHAKMGHEVTVISSASDDTSLYFDMSLIRASNASSKEGNSLGYTILRLPIKHKTNFRFWEFKHLIQTLEKLQPKLIFFHGAPMLCLLDLAKYKKAHPQVKLVMDCHTDYNNSAHGFVSRVLMHKLLYRWVIRYTLKEVDWYYYLAPNIKTFMKDMYLISDNKLKFLPRGGMLEHMNFKDAATIRYQIRESLQISQDDIVVVSGGKLDAKKMSHCLVEAINGLAYTNVHLILFGTIDKEYEQQLVTAVGDNRKIHLTGWIDSKDVYNYYLASDIACFPGGHSVLWEQAICCGLPLVIKNWYQGMHYLDVKNNVIMLPDSDVIYIKSALEMLFKDAELCAAMRTNAETVGREYFSYRRIAESILHDIKQK